MNTESVKDLYLFVVVRYHLIGSQFVRVVTSIQTISTIQTVVESRVAGKFHNVPQMFV